MKCGEFKKHMEDLIDGCIDSRLKEDMELHMDSCISCRDEYTGIKSITDSLRRDAASISLKDSQRKGLKEVILKASARKKRDLVIMKRLMCAAAIFMFMGIGIHFIRGVKVDIAPVQPDESPLLNQISDLKVQITTLESQKKQLESDKSRLQKDNETLRKSLKEKEKNTVPPKDWTMVNAGIGEAYIQGKVLSLDGQNKSIKLDIYKDDNTPNIDPNIVIPDGIYIFNQHSGNESFKAGTVNDLKTGDYIALHYLSKSKSARAILLIKESPAGS